MRVAKNIDFALISSVKMIFIEGYEPVGYYEVLGKNIFIAKINDADMLRDKKCSMIDLNIKERKL